MCGQPPSAVSSAMPGFASSEDPGSPECQQSSDAAAGQQWAAGAGAAVRVPDGHVPPRRVPEPPHGAGGRSPPRIREEFDCSRAAV